MTPRPACRVCGKPVPEGRRTICSKSCEAEYNRRSNRAAHYRRKGMEPPAEKRQHHSPVKLPPGAWFKCIYDGTDNDSIMPHHTYAREAVRDFVANGDPVEWYQPVG